MTQFFVLGDKIQNINVLTIRGIINKTIHFKKWKCCLVYTYIFKPKFIYIDIYLSYFLQQSKEQAIVKVMI